MKVINYGQLMNAIVPWTEIFLKFNITTKTEAIECFYRSDRSDVFSNVVDICLLESILEMSEMPEIKIIFNIFDINRIWIKKYFKSMLQIIWNVKLKACINSN